MHIGKSKASKAYFEAKTMRQESDQNLTSQSTHFKDKYFQAHDYTGTDNQTRNTRENIQ